MASLSTSAFTTISSSSSSCSLKLSLPVSSFTPRSLSSFTSSNSSLSSILKLSPASPPSLRSPSPAESRLPLRKFKKCTSTRSTGETVEVLRFSD